MSTRNISWGVKVAVA